MPEREKYCCYDYTWDVRFKREGEEADPSKAADCPGVLATASAEGYNPEGYYIQVCPRAKWLGKAAGFVEYCGNGPNVIILHRDTEPSSEEYQQAVKDSDNDW